MLPLTKIKQLFKTEFKMEGMKKHVNSTTYAFTLIIDNNEYPFYMDINKTSWIKIYHRGCEIFNFPEFCFDKEQNVVSVIKGIKTLITTMVEYNISTLNIANININYHTSEATIYFNFDNCYCNLYCSEKKFLITSNDSRHDFKSYEQMVELVKHQNKLKEEKYLKELAELQDKIKHMSVEDFKTFWENK